jgi:hypothetical protein
MSGKTHYFGTFLRVLRAKIYVTDVSTVYIFQIFSGRFAHNFFESSVELGLMYETRTCVDDL